MKRKMKIATGALSCLLLAAVGLWGQQTEETKGGTGTVKWFSCPYPLSVNSQWTYDVFKGSSKVGALAVAGKKMEEKKTGGESQIQYFDVAFEDTYTNKKYVRRFLRDFGFIFVLNSADKKYYPFIRNSLLEGDQIERMLATDISLAKFQNSERSLITLQDLDRDRVEKYMGGIGLFFYKNGDVEYRLVSATIEKDGLDWECGRQHK